MYRSPSIEKLQNESLLNTYYDAVSFNLEEEFIKILANEIKARGLSVEKTHSREKTTIGLCKCSSHFSKEYYVS